MVPSSIHLLSLLLVLLQGCDASILIDSTKNKTSEKAAGPNLTVRGFEIIDEAKASLEKQCPSTVSCADIITVATRDAVSLAGGPNFSSPQEEEMVSSPAPKKSTYQDPPSPSPKPCNLSQPKGSPSMTWSFFWVHTRLAWLTACSSETGSSIFKGQELLILPWILVWLQGSGASADRIRSL